jgi:hypothetical protein
MAQWNGYVPAAVKVRVCVPELITPMSPPCGAAASNTTLCATPELFVKVTVAPRATVRVGGVNDPVPVPVVEYESGATNVMQIVFVPQLD